MLHAAKTLLCLTGSIFLKNKCRRLQLVFRQDYFTDRTLQKLNIGFVLPYLHLPLRYHRQLERSIHWRRNTIGIVQAPVLRRFPTHRPNLRIFPTALSNSSTCITRAELETGKTFHYAGEQKIYPPTTFRRTGIFCRAAAELCSMNTRYRDNTDLIFHKYPSQLLIYARQRGISSFEIV